MPIGNGNVNAIFTKSLTLSDTQMPCLALNYSLGQIAGESVNASFWKATCQITEPSSKPVIIITRKSRTTAGVLTAGTFTPVACTDITYTITGAAAKSAWTGTATAQTANASTLKEAIDLLNEVPGIQAWAMHAPHGMSLNSDQFLVASEADIPTQPGLYHETLYRDVSEYVIDTDKKVAWMRVGIPELRDAGSMKLLQLNSIVTGATGGLVKIYRDDIRDYGTEYSATYATDRANKQTYLNKTLVNTVLTEYVGATIENAVTIRGPVIVEISASDLTACVATMAIMQASI